MHSCLLLSIGKVNDSNSARPPVSICQHSKLLHGLFEENCLVKKKKKLVFYWLLCVNHSEGQSIFFFVFYHFPAFLLETFFFLSVMVKPNKIQWFPILY